MTRRRSERERHSLPERNPLSSERARLRRPTRASSARCVVAIGKEHDSRAWLRLARDGRVRPPIHPRSKNTTRFFSLMFGLLHRRSSHPPGNRYRSRLCPNAACRPRYSRVLKSRAFRAATPGVVQYRGSPLGERRCDVTLDMAPGSCDAGVDGSEVGGTLARARRCGHRSHRGHVGRRGL